MVRDMAAQPDKKTVIKDLLELGKSKGQLSTKEILDALGELTGRTAREEIVSRIFSRFCVGK